MDSRRVAPDSDKARCLPLRAFRVVSETSGVSREGDNERNRRLGSSAATGSQDS
jgi:hypothetical protein